MTEPAEPSKRPGRPLRSSSFKYYIHDGVANCRLQLIGELSEADLGELNGCWRTAKTTLGKRPLILDLRALESVDEAGKQWLAGMAQEGASCLPENYLRDLVAGKHIAGAALPQAAPKPGLIGRIVGLFRGGDVAAAK
ncbi:MAG TPA: hypothetical protein VKX25_21000 [Bryobacteraceae bacterium]|jgi:hypothetical protein|nr:hypothetical protein [Bryobacteraceae bacterium]